MLLFKRRPWSEFTVAEKLQYVASIGSRYQHQQAAKVLPTT